MTSFVSVDRLSGLVAPGDLVVVGQGSAEPTALTQELIRQRHAVSGLRLFVGVVLSDTFDPERTDGVSF